MANTRVLISMDDPTKAMRTEVAKAGFYEPPFGGKEKHYSRMQLLTVAELLQRKGVAYPEYRANIGSPRSMCVKRSSKSVQSRDVLNSVLKQAGMAGELAAQKQYKKLRAGSKHKDDLLDLCGGAWVELKVDGRTKLGQLLLDVNKHPTSDQQFRLSRARHGGIRLDIRVQFYQELTVSEVRARKALQVLEAALGVKGYAWSMRD